MTTKVKEMTVKPNPPRPAPLMLEGMALLEAVGNTPLLPLRRVTKELSPDVKVYAKAEWFNPGG